MKGQTLQYKLVDGRAYALVINDGDGRRLWVSKSETEIATFEAPEKDFHSMLAWIEFVQKELRNRYDT